MRDEGVFDLSKYRGTPPAAQWVDQSDIAKTRHLSAKEADLLPSGCDTFTITGDYNGHLNGQVRAEEPLSEPRHAGPTGPELVRKLNCQSALNPPLRRQSCGVTSTGFTADAPPCRGRDRSNASLISLDGEMHGGR